MKFKVGDYVRFVGNNLGENDYELVADIVTKNKIYKIVNLVRHLHSTPCYMLEHICDNGKLDGLLAEHYQPVINITKEQKDKLLNMIREI